ncbi:MAG: phosphotransferase [Candidatus Delongbacteria bacterium]|nr:phosphotransferase [Candidatus Delongbacteria bacterium]MBN2835335.1 phosphotransferase [Candidatus Delongbacteria bacterium]
MKKSILFEASKLIKNQINEFENVSGGLSGRLIFRAITISDSYICVYNENLQENEAYFSFNNSLNKAGVFTPEILNISKNRKTYILEDFGENSLFQLSLADKQSIFVGQMYRRIAALLPKLLFNTDKFIDYTKCYQGDIFDKNTIEMDLDLFEIFLRENKIEKRNNLQYKQLMTSIKSNPLHTTHICFLYRDFQPRNILIKNNEPYFIDFQSGRKGNPWYDISSFIYSSSTFVNEVEGIELISIFCDNLIEFMDISKESAIEKIYESALIRLAQMLGRYNSVKNTHPNVVEKIDKVLPKFLQIYKKLTGCDFI